MKLLFIAPIFYDYHKIIQGKLSEHYDEVLFRNEIPYKSTIKFYALKLLSPFWAARVLVKYNRQLSRLVETEKIDRIFIIRGYGLQECFFQKIKETSPCTVIFQYQWDSLHNNPNGEMISHYSDHNFSFDLADTCVFKQFRYLPLFYIGDILGDNKSKMDDCDQNIDLLFVGGYHSQRHLIVSQVKEYCKKNGLTIKSHIYIYWGTYLKNRLTTRTMHWDDVSFKKLSRIEYYKLLYRSRVVLDIQSSTQTGATMRTIETLSMHKKVLSTNLALVNEPFYSDKNILTWNPKTPLNIHSLMDTSFDSSKDDEVLNLDSWLIRLGLLSPIIQEEIEPNFENQK